ncbi:hypothetical protein L2E82_27957 [Cichorium intybus]|uniref:Uncharacterized protein n=1 Tax=Cichorium intybus TaxID=13427 RepID=A0ACB9CUI5_CICIN|nr:hypothetical protein L2E82_27957 [Cichorium intybus]
MANNATHFFKFVPPGFLYNITIRRSFLTNVNVKRCSKAMLRCGRHEWSIDIDNGVFGEGWRKFVRENGVQEFDFIVFKHQGSMVFDQSTSCEKEYPNLCDEMEREESLKESNTFRTHSKLAYVINKSRLYLPVDFSKANGFKIGEMILRDDKGRSWKAHLNRSKEKYFYLGLGLRPFLVVNGMKEGDAFKFELVEN